MRRVATPSTMSKRILDLDWSTVLPWMLGDDSSVEHGTFDDALPFIREHYPQIFGSAAPRFLAEEMTPAKQRFLDEMDVFLFRADGQTVGIGIGHPTDWSTYYVRTLAVLPEFRERRFSSDFGRHINAPLVAAGVERLEAECSPANTAMVRLFVSLGFMVTSTVSSERWGMMMRFTKFLTAEAEKVFRRQFIYVPAFGRNPQPT